MLTVKRFTASWCGPCKMLAPIFEQLTKQFPDITFETYDTDAFPELAQDYGIRSIPVVLIFNDVVTKPLATLVGAYSKNIYVDKIQDLQKHEG